MEGLYLAKYEGGSNVEVQIRKARENQKINNLPSDQVSHKLGMTIKSAVVEAGFTLNKEFALIFAKIMQIIQTYYSDLTPEEVSLAFDFLVIGELDEFLPKDRYGEPDRSSYGRFNAEFVCKVLNAYKKKRQRSNTQSLQEPVENTEELERQAREDAKERIVKNYEKYLEDGTFAETQIGELIIFETMRELGMVRKLDVTEDDKKQAMQDIIRRSYEGLMNKYTAGTIRKEGLESKDVKNIAEIFASNKAIISVFQRMKEKNFTPENLKAWLSEK